MSDRSSDRRTSDEDIFRSGYAMITGDKLTFDCQKDRWESQPIKLKCAKEPFSQGGMRLAYRAREVLSGGDEFDVVVKRFKPDMWDDGFTGEDVYHEAMTQMVAENHAQDFNKLCAEKGLQTRYSIAFLPASVVRTERDGENGQYEPLAMEPYLPGEYRKFNDNNGHTETESDVVNAFCYFTYIHSNKLMVVTDIQGVGTFYTDPQIHTFDGEGFGAGNMGQEGIERWLRGHTHNLICEQLGLPSPDEGLTDEELARKLQAMMDLEASEAGAMGALQGGGGLGGADADGFGGGCCAARCLAPCPSCVVVVSGWPAALWTCSQ